MHQTYISVHHLVERNLPCLADYLRGRKVRYYSGYPSGLYLVACFFLRHGIRLPHPPAAVITAAETVLPYQRSAIEAAFGASIGDFYGASEQAGNLSECEYHNYHVDWEFGLAEFLPVEGMPDRVRRIVLTGLRNPVMPLIRYDTGDYATLGEGPCPCGRAGPIIRSIDGRIEGYVRTPDGRQLGRLDFLFKNSQHIEEAQLVQDDLSSVTVKVVRNCGYTGDDEVRLLSDLRLYLGGVIGINIQYLQAIPREANGKFRQIVSRLQFDQEPANAQLIKAGGGAEHL